MSVIVQKLKDGDGCTPDGPAFLFCKGADSIVLDLLDVGPREAWEVQKAKEARRRVRLCRPPMPR